MPLSLTSLRVGVELCLMLMISNIAARSNTERTVTRKILGIRTRTTVTPNCDDRLRFHLVFCSGATPVTAWFTERSKYNENNPETALHFTQVVWKNTKTLGVGVCNAKDGSVVFVANYYPRGNYKDPFAQNVLCKGSN